MTPSNEFTTSFPVGTFVIKDTKPDSLDKSWIALNDLSGGYPYNVGLLKAKQFDTKEQAQKYVHIFQRTNTNAMGSDYWIVMKLETITAKLRRI